ncbi:type IV pilus modification PilV family protein [Futiania mangrovi]|uniref:Prepilin-type N-terminal cleavage/methylation domain-containing protein n=1 Tax=Futiania mangrovi TaxID=2959716 RepID=A0A9J6PH95_9PROT|nr:hypothetical protein [Futiania mangrovii]MCP1337878.1 hypothetical protein [Futiania mangrovii]
MRSDAGFSLLEAVIGFAVAALALVPLLQVYASSGQAGQRSAALLTAVELAETAIGRFDAAPAPGTQAPVVERGLEWVLSASPLSGEGTGARLLRVTVTVRTPESQRPVHVLTTLRHVPPAGAAGGRPG